MCSELIQDQVNVFHWLLYIKIFIHSSPLFHFHDKLDFITPRRGMIHKPQKADAVRSQYNYGDCEVH